MIRKKWVPVFRKRSWSNNKLERDALHPEIIVLQGVMDAV
jgi:hypothetical protein